MQPRCVAVAYCGGRAGLGPDVTEAGKFGEDERETQNRSSAIPQRSRLGPNKLGFTGLLQPLADAIKPYTKETRIT